MKKRLSSVFVLFIVMALLAQPVFAADTASAPTAAVSAGTQASEFISLADEDDSPLVYLDSAQGSVGDLITVTLSLGHVAGFTNGSFIIQYNPYMLQYEGFQLSTQMFTANVSYVVTDETGANVKDENGVIAHDVRIALVHMDEFPEELTNCDIGTITFRAIAGGSCDLEVTAREFDFDMESVTPRVHSGVAVIEGEPEASTWDYDAHTVPLVTVPDGPYEVAQSSGGLSTVAKVLIFLAIIVVVVLLVVMIARGKNISDEEEPEGDAEKAADEAAQTPGADDAQPADTPQEAPEDEGAEKAETDPPKDEPSSEK